MVYLVEPSKEAIQEVSNLNLGMPFSLLPEFSSNLPPRLTALVMEGHLTPQQIQLALIPPVLRQARNDFEYLLKGQRERRGMQPEADHLDKPRFLAYAIAKKALNKSELAQIRFDHGYTPQTFCREFDPSTLLKDLTDRLLSPQNYIPATLPNDPNCCYG